ncbi:hypothetical protein [Pseudomonas sp. NCCP-436]|uniref:hypothetical protein n=1 Tax=Pseudomonas sp. NCCP-436 TaxID=2842481 RepID=UPI001C7EADD8|nr:hypothetical protein [Pseudomonas sp. NCCP-436]GIZ13339.1 hypothetical protein NCCP436_27550 [Pseudomonas sp. NCCP-436]
MIVNLENRLIAFLDVLGFSARLESEEIESLHKQYSSFIDEAKNATFFAAQGDNTGRKNFDFSQFLFDSIVLVSCPIDDVYNVNNFISAVSLLLELGFKNKLPLRGAISQGNFLHDEERNIFLSERFPELAKFELRQEWAGCTVLRHAEETIAKSALGISNISAIPTEQTRNQLFHRYKAPLKNGETFDSIVLNYMFFLSEEEILEGIEYLIPGKKEHNIAYFEFLKSLPLPLQKLQPEFFPAEYFTYIATRSGMRAKFINSEGKPCVPGVKEITWMAIGH